MKTLLSALLLALLLPCIGFSQEAEPAKAPVFVIVTGDRAHVRTLPDKKGPSVMAPEVGQLLQVTGAKRAAFLPVVAPGGFAVWIFGRNLKPTDEEGVLVVTANAVNQRPMPSSENKSYPLSRRLHGGDRVRVIGRHDASKPLAEDWVQVWSSADSVGWILQTECKPVKADGAAMWAEAMATLGDRTAAPRAEPVGAPKVAGAAATAQVSGQAAVQAQLAAADELLAQERAKRAPDFGVVRSAYDKLLAQKVGGEIERSAKASLELVSVLEAAYALESDLEAAKQRRITDVLARQKQLWEESRQRDPMSGRFDARGVLERRGRAGQSTRYVLRWGPDLVCEVRCASGRYDLDKFAGYELGLKGMLSYSEPDALLADSPVLEVGRIEVLSRR